MGFSPDLAFCQTKRKSKMGLDDPLLARPKFVRTSDGYAATYGNFEKLFHRLGELTRKVPATNFSSQSSSATTLLDNFSPFERVKRKFKRINFFLGTLGFQEAFRILAWEPMIDQFSFYSNLGFSPSFVIAGARAYRAKPFDARCILRPTYANVHLVIACVACVYDS